MEDKEKQEARKRLKAQLDQWFFRAKSIKLNCAHCGDRIVLAHSYRCFYCGFVFCRVCSDLHFAQRNTDEELQYSIRAKKDGLIYPILRIGEQTNIEYESQKEL